MFRYTIKEIEEFSDYQMLKRVVIERQSTLTNIYSPLHRRLDKILGKLGKKEELSKEV